MSRLMVIDQPPVQTLGLVVRAEVRRLRRRGGLPTGLAVSVGIGLLVGIAAVLILRSLDQGQTHLLVTVPIEAAVVTTILALALFSISVIGRDFRGQLAIAATQTPNRSRLHGARAIAVTTLAGAAALLTGAVILILAMVLTTSTGGGLGVLSLLLGTAAAMLTVLIAVSLVTILRRSGPAALIFIAAQVVLPLALGALAGLAPASLAPMISGLYQFTPSALLIQAVSASTVPTLGLDSVVAGVIGLLIWAVALAAVAWIVVRKRDV